MSHSFVISIVSQRGLFNRHFCQVIVHDTRNVLTGVETTLNLYLCILCLLVISYFLKYISMCMSEKEVEFFSFLAKQFCNHASASSVTSVRQL